LFGVLAFVPRLLHEFSHALLGAPFAHEVRVGFSLDQYHAYCDVEFKDWTPAWGVWLAFLAPFFLGTGFLTAAGVYALLYGVPLPQGVEGWLWSGILGVWWTIYAYPSRQDRVGAHAIVNQLQSTEAEGETDTAGSGVA
jgi:hypothetical protein